jgi:large subunit ribosomal protein L35
MPSIKLKSHKGTLKRFKVTPNGKVLHKACGSSHINSHKSGNKIRSLRRKRALQSAADAERCRIVVLANKRRKRRKSEAEIAAGPQAPWRRRGPAATADAAPATN